MPSQIIAILRKESDSVVRVIYLLSQEPSRRMALNRPGLRKHQFRSGSRVLRNDLIGARFSQADNLISIVLSIDFHPW